MVPYENKIPECARVPRSRRMARDARFNLPESTRNSLDILPPPSLSLCALETSGLTCMKLSVAPRCSPFLSGGCRVRDSSRVRD